MAQLHNKCFSLNANTCEQLKLMSDQTEMSQSLLVRLLIMNASKMVRSELEPLDP